MSQKTAYHRLTERVIEDNRIQGIRPRLLLHCCCAPCATVPLVDWADAFELTAYYYNPNIHPPTEAEVRAEELKKFVSAYPFTNRPAVIIGDYDPETFYQAVRGLEKEPERGKRCEVCFRLRFEQTARLAAEGGYDYFTTTLSISSHKDAALLHKLGLEAQERWGVKYLPCDLKKKEGMKRSAHLSAEYGLYRQDYCGCVFSQREKREVDARCCKE